MNILAEVKSATRSEHQQVERLLPFFSAKLNVNSYRETLSSFLGIFEPLEERLSEAMLPPEYGLRGRAELLKYDLRNLGLAESEISALPRCSIPAFANLESALGAMYVLEGSTLGGQFIARHVHETLGLDSNSGCAFFRCNGPNVATSWQSFCDLVSRHIVTEGGQHRFIASAKSIFATLEQWIAREDVETERNTAVSDTDRRSY